MLQARNVFQFGTELSIVYVVTNVFLLSGFQNFEFRMVTEKLDTVIIKPANIFFFQNEIQTACFFVPNYHGLFPFLNSTIFLVKCPVKGSISKYPPSQLNNLAVFSSTLSTPVYGLVIPGYFIPS